MEVVALISAGTATALVLTETSGIVTVEEIVTGVTVSEITPVAVTGGIVVTAEIVTVLVVAPVLTVGSGVIVAAVIVAGTATAPEPVETGGIVIAAGNTSVVILISAVKSEKKVAANIRTGLLVPPVLTTGLRTLIEQDKVEGEAVLPVLVVNAGIEIPVEIKDVITVAFDEPSTVGLVIDATETIVTVVFVALTWPEATGAGSEAAVPIVVVV